MNKIEFKFKLEGGDNLDLKMAPMDTVLRLY